MNQNFLAYSKYYDLLYQDKDYQSEIDYIVKLLKEVAPKAVNILELGSGTGIHGLLLNSAGYDVFGVERSNEMALVAKDKGFECDVCDIINYKTDKRYDVVMSLFHVVSYLTSNQDLTSVFKNANNHLNKDGVFVFDVWYTPAVYEQKPQLRLKKMEDEECEITRIANPVIDYNNHIVNVEFTVIVKNKKNNQFNELFEVHPMRHFSYNEILFLAQISGFELIKSEEFLTGNNSSQKTWGVCFVLKKVMN